jgi:hypothetical protein
VESATGCSGVRCGQDHRNPASAPTGNANAAGTLMSPCTAQELAPADADDVAQLDKVTLIALDAATVATVEYGAYY